MVLDQLGEPSHLRIETGPFRHRPALQGAAHLKTQIVMEAAGMVFLDDEDPPVRGRRIALRLRRVGEAPLGSVGFNDVRPGTLGYQRR
jgi:hypothetical protein